MKIISLRGASCFQRDFFASLGGACGFTASEEEGTPVTYSCGYGEIPPEGYMLELKGDCAELRASDSSTGSGSREGAIFTPKTAVPKKFLEILEKLLKNG